MEGGAEVQFLGQIAGIGLPLERSVLRMGVGRTRVGQNHIHKGKVFLSRGLSAEVRMRL
uniref:Uncharacterized protein n=1 Tax=Anguilla anguilla TaxID=7936 RepID=A0A0E9XYP5_ANGAN